MAFDNLRDMSFQPSEEEWTGKVSAFIEHEVQSQVSEAFHDLRKELLSELTVMRSKLSKSIKQSNSSTRVTPDVDTKAKSDQSKQGLAQADNAKHLDVEKPDQMQAQIDDLTAIVKLLDQDFRMLKHKANFAGIERQLAMVDAILVSMTADRLEEAEKRSVVFALRQQRVALLASAVEFQEGSKSNLVGNAQLAQKDFTGKPESSIPILFSPNSMDILQLPVALRQVVEKPLSPRSKGQEDKDKKVYDFVVDSMEPIGMGFSTIHAGNGTAFRMVKKIQEGSKAAGLVKVGDRLVDVNNNDVSQFSDAELFKMLQKRPLQMRFSALRQSPMPEKPLSNSEVSL